MFTLDEVLSKSNQKEALEFLTIKGNSRGAEGMLCLIWKNIGI